jgi:YfiH family protein
VTEEDSGKGIVKDRDYDDVDGLITNVKGLTLVTQYADCVGLLFYDPQKKVIATSHAGWRGTVGEIGRLTVEKMSAVFGCKPKDIRVGIAPSIGMCCFEVDTPVYEEFSKITSFDTNSIIKNDGGGKYHIDLWRANLLSLLNAGVPNENISITDLCTKCHPDVFFSHRFTNGKRGNLAALICLK